MSAHCPTKRKIICLETKKIYDSARAIEKEFGFANANIIACCKKKLSTAYGYHWLYLEEYENGSYQTRQDKRKKKVYCITTNTIYESAAEAARATKTERANISACCAGRLKTAGGYEWRYAE